MTTTATMGRPILGPALVDRLDGGDRAKLITKTILETIAGTRTIAGAARVLDCNNAYVHALRERLLTATIAAAEPRALGPAPAPAPVPDPKLLEALAAAEASARDAQVALELERCRTELALVLGPRLGAKKNARRRR